MPRPAFDTTATQSRRGKLELGIPADGVRDIPDVSAQFASDGPQSNSFLRGLGGADALSAGSAPSCRLIWRKIQLHRRWRNPRLRSAKPCRNIGAGSRQSERTRVPWVKRAPGKRQFCAAPQNRPDGQPFVQFEQPNGSDEAASSRLRVQRCNQGQQFCTVRRCITKLQQRDQRNKRRVSHHEWSHEDAGFHRDAGLRFGHRSRHRERHEPSCGLGYCRWSLQGHDHRIDDFAGCDHTRNGSDRSRKLTVTQDHSGVRRPETFPSAATPPTKVNAGASGDVTLCSWNQASLSTTPPARRQFSPSAALHGRWNVRSQRLEWSASGP